MEIIKVVLFVLIGGLIGWLTNKVAIKMLFRPVNPHRFLKMNIQGVFPRRKDEIAKSLAKIIENELLTKDEMMNQLLSEDKIEHIKKKLNKIIVDKISEAIPPAISMFMGNDAKNMIEQYIDKHGDDIFSQLIDEFKETSFENLDVYGIVKKQIDALDFIEFEKIIFGLMNKELKFVEIVGLFLGGLIGIIQYIISIFL